MWDIIIFHKVWKKETFQHTDEEIEALEILVVLYFIKCNKAGHVQKVHNDIWVAAGQQEIHIKYLGNLTMQQRYQEVKETLLKSANTNNKRTQEKAREPYLGGTWPSSKHTDLPA